MHPRKIIRDAVVAALTGTTSAGSRVKATRVEPMGTQPSANRGSGLPALAVYTPEDQVDADAAMYKPLELWHTLTLKVTAWVVDTAAFPVDDAMDAIAEQIEAAMSVDRYFGGACGGKVGSILASTETGVLDDGDPLIGVITLTFRCEYADNQAPATGLADYLRTHTTTQRDGAGPDNVVQDQFNQRA